MTPTVASLFCGLGGLDLGFDRAGFDVVWANDVLEDAVLSYEVNFNRTPVLGSISDIDISEIPETDVIIGGPPCQSFSLVGRRDPGDPRGALVFRFLEIIRQRRPRSFVLENVPGIAASRVNGVRLTDVLIAAFESMGYKVGKFSLLATDFGVPQLRRRVVVIGGLDFTPLEPSGSQFCDAVFALDEPMVTARDAIGDLGPCVRKGDMASYLNDYVPSEFAQRMRAGAKLVSLHECPRMSETDKALVEFIPPGGNYTDVPDRIATPRIMKFKRSGGRTTTYGRLHPDKPSYTINTYFRRPNVGANFHFEQPRLITPREAMRFQSFPDNFEVRFRTQDGRNALIGNAVPPQMAHGIAWSLAQQIEARSKMSDSRG